MGLPSTIWLDGGAEESVPDWEKPGGRGTWRTTASRPGCHQPLPPGEYVCRRCGAQREYNVSREKPTHCRDCRDVLAYKEPERKPPVQFPVHLTDEECLAARKAFRRGERSPELEVAAREYWRRMAARKRQREGKAS